MLKTTANPTFTTKVKLSVAGVEKPVEVQIEFKHLTKKALKAYHEGLKRIRRRIQPCSAGIRAGKLLGIGR